MGYGEVWFDAESLPNKIAGKFVFAGLFGDQTQEMKCIGMPWVRL